MSAMTPLEAVAEQEERELREERAARRAKIMRPDGGPETLRKPRRLRASGRAHIRAGARRHQSR